MKMGGGSGKNQKDAVHVCKQRFSDVHTDLKATWFGALCRWQTRCKSYTTYLHAKTINKFIKFIKYVCIEIKHKKVNAPSPYIP